MGGCEEKARKKEAERSLQAVKCSQPQYIAYGLTFSRLTQHSQSTAEPLYQRDAESFCSSASSLRAFYNCLSAHLTSHIQKHFIKKCRLGPSSQRQWPLIGSGPVCLWGNSQLPAVCPLTKLHKLFSPSSHQHGTYRRQGGRPKHRWLDLMLHILYLEIHHIHRCQM